MSEDTSYIQNYKARRVYVNVSPDQGAYASLADDLDETVVGEIELNNRTRIAVSAFFSKDKNELRTVKFHLLRYRTNSGWWHDETMKFNGFEAAKLEELLTVFSHLKLDTSKSQRFNVGTISADNFFSFQEQSDILKSISNDPRLKKDVFALASKKVALQEFEAHLENDVNETVWQNFLENNPWIFGFGLNYIFLDKVGPKFEAITTGADFTTIGKRADGLAKTRAKISQSVLIEIKASKTKLLEHNEYRKDVWPATKELNGAVFQSQKTTFEFSKKFSIKAELTDEEGNDTGEMLYTANPRSYLIVGNLSELEGNKDKIAAFELYRRNLIAPEIITFDELYFRAVELVKGLSS